MENRKVVNDLTTAVKNSISILATKSTDALEKLKHDYDTEQEKTYKTQMFLQYHQKAVCVSFSLAYVLRQTKTSVPLCAIDDFRALDFRPEMSSNLSIFPFAWYKSVYNYPATQTELADIMSQINRKIGQSVLQLYMRGYTQEYLQCEYPALYYGMVVANVVDTPTSVILYIRANL